MKRLAFLLLSSLAFGQGVILPPQQALKVVNGITSPVSNATITVCAANTSGIPCAPALVGAVFKDAALTQPLSNPFTTDANGNYSFAMASGTFTVTVSAANFVGYSYQITVPLAAGANLSFTGTTTFSGPANLNGGGTITGGFGISAKSVNNTQYADQFAGADACAKIAAAHSVLSTTGGIIDATGFVGSQTCAAGLTLGTTTGPIVLKLPSTFIAIPSNPCVTITAGTSVTILGMGENATSSSIPTISCTSSTAGAVAIKWLGSRGGMERVQVQMPNTMEGLLLDANAAGQDVKFNTFKDLSFISGPSNTNDGVQLNAVDPTHKVSFNNFINMELVDFQQAFDLTMQAGGSFGPTDNDWFGGQARRTTSAAGTGIAVGQAAQNNWFFGGNYSFFTTGISIAAFATTVQNNFYGVIVESVGTTPCSIGAGAADNHFYGVSCSAGGLNSTDSGNSTLFDNVNLSGLTLSKIGRPLTATPFAGCAIGLPAATPGGAGMWLTGNCTSPVAGRIYVGDGTGFQVNFSKRTGSTDTDLWAMKDSGVFTGPIGNAVQTVASGTATMTTTAIAAGACGTTVTVAAANVATTDTITWAFNAAPGGQNAGLVAWPTSGNVNFAYCSNTAETPAAATINWRVVR